MGSYQPHPNYHGAPHPGPYDPAFPSGAYEMRTHPPSTPAPFDSSGSLLAGAAPTKENTDGGHVYRPSKSGSDRFSWTLEFLSLLLSVVALAGAVVLVVYFNQRPITEWPIALSLATVVSVLASIARTSLAFAMSAGIAQGKWNWFAARPDKLIAFDRFEDASKGPFGCLRLLPTVVRRGHWITLGAIGTIILVGYEPFLQAVLNLEDRVVVAPVGASGLASDEAALGRCTKLDAGTYVELDGRSSQGIFPFKGPDGQNLTIDVIAGFDVQADPGMMAAVWLGLSAQATARNLSPLFGCTSGNCSWDAFPSLAVCSRCNDLSLRLVKSVGTVNIPGRTSSGYLENATFPDVTNSASRANEAIDIQVDYPYTKYTITGLAPLNLSNYDGPPRCKRGDQKCPDTYFTGKLETNPGRTLGFRDLQTMITAFQYIVAGGSWRANKTRWEDTPVLAGECALYYCINAYASTVKNGELAETVVGSWAKKTPRSYSSVQDRETVDAYTAHYNNTLDYVNIGGDFDRTDLQLYIPPDVAGLGFDPGSVKFNVTHNTIGTTIRYLTEVIGGHVQPGDLLDVPFVAFHYPSRASWSPMPDLMAALGSAASTVSERTGNDIMNATFERAAGALSKWMRDRAFRNDIEEIQGQVLTGFVSRATVVFVAHWGFLILPLTALLMGLIFFCLSVWNTKSKGLPAWKSSSLVNLAFGLDQADKAELRDALLRKDVSAAARETTARFRKGGPQPGLELSRATGSYMSS